MLVAVYGSLKKGFGNHFLLEKSRFVDTLSLSGYDMYSLGRFPAIVRGSGTITVELYDVDCETLERLDRLEGFSGIASRYNAYNREEIDTPYGKAFIYIYANEQRLGGRVFGLVTSGNWEKTGEYYGFQPYIGL